MNVSEESSFFHSAYTRVLRVLKAFCEVGGVLLKSTAAFFSPPFFFLLKNTSFYSLASCATSFMYL